MTTAKRRVVVVGSLNADTIIRVSALPSPGETILASEVHSEPGGKSSNQAAAAALLDADVSLFGVVGSDAAGDRLLLEAASRGVATDGITRSVHAATGSAFVMVDEAGENSIIVDIGANSTLVAEHVPDAAFADRPVVVLALESPIEVITDLAARASAAGALVLLNASPATALPHRLLTTTDILVVNGGEVEDLTGLGPATHTWEEIAAALLEIGVHRALVTLGAHGAIVLDHGAVTTLSAVRVKAVDTTGCGDAFMGAVAAELSFGRSLVEAAQLGVRAGAWAAQSLGAQPSYGRRGEIDTLASEARLA